MAEKWEKISGLNEAFISSFTGGASWQEDGDILIPSGGQVIIEFRQPVINYSDVEIITRAVSKQEIFTLSLIADVDEPLGQRTWIDNAISNYNSDFPNHFPYVGRVGGIAITVQDAPGAANGIEIVGINFTRRPSKITKVIDATKVSGTFPAGWTFDGTRNSWSKSLVASESISVGFTPIAGYYAYMAVALQPFGVYNYYTFRYFSNFIKTTVPNIEVYWDTISPIEPNPETLTFNLDPGQFVTPSVTVESAYFPSIPSAFGYATAQVPQQPGALLANLGSAAYHADTEYLKTGNNLGDVVDKAAGRTNLGLGTFATQNVFGATLANMNSLSMDYLTANFDITTPALYGISRSLKTQLAERCYNVKDFGAIGDGVANDYAAIQNCFDAANTHALGAVVFFPAGKYRVATPLNANHIFLQGAGYARAPNDGGVEIIGDLAVSPIITVAGSAGSSSAGMANILVNRAAGAIPANSVGIQVVNSNGWKITDCKVLRSDIGYQVLSNAVNGRFERNDTGNITGTHLWLEGYGLLAHSCRFGTDGGGDVNGNEYVRVKGFGDTYFFIGCHFNLSANRVTRMLYFDNYSSPNGIINFVSCHVELCNSGVAQTGTTNVDRLSFENCTIDVGGTPNPMFNVPAGFFTRMNMVGTFVHGDVALNGFTHQKVIGNHFTDSLVVTGGNGQVARNNIGSNFTVTGACTSLFAGHNNILSNLATYTDTATGLVSTFGNYQGDATKTAAIVQSLNGTLNLLQGRCQFPSSQNASANANTLDDYVENDSFVPTLTASSGTFTTATITFSYTKVGRKVTFRATITITTNGTAAGNTQFTLPFTPATKTAVSVWESDVTGFAGGGVVQTNGKCLLTKYDGTYLGANLAVIHVAGSYFV
jgi:hypothetical protein